jgi:hypothetical protein
LSIVTRPISDQEAPAGIPAEAKLPAVPVAVALLTAASLLLFWPALFAGRTLFGRDITPFFYPMKNLLAESVRAGRIPWWNPGIANGEPFFATLQPGVFYPGSLPLFMLPLSVSFDWVVALHYPLAGVGMLLLLRRWNASVGAAWLGAVAFMLGGYLVSLGNFPNNLQTAAWIPWLFWSWDRVLEACTARRLATFSALCAVAFLGGEPQVLAIALSWLFLHGLSNIESRSMGRLRQSVCFGAAGAMALAVVAIQLVPFVELIRHSVRTMPVGIEYAASLSLEPSALIHLAIPPVLNEGVHGFTTRFIAAVRTPWILSPYPGALVGGLALIGVATVSRRRAVFWSLSALLGLLLALGPSSPVYRLLFETVPVLRPFRYPEKFLLLTAMAAAVLAAWAADALFRVERRGTVTKLLGTMALLYAAVAAVFTVFPGIVERVCIALPQGVQACADPRLTASLYAGPSLRIAVLVALAAALVAIGGRGRLRPEAATGLLAMLVLADLTAAHSAVNPSVEASIYERPPWPARALDSLGASRSAYRFRGSPHDAAMGKIIHVRGAYALSNLYLDFETMGPNVGLLDGWLHQDGLQGVELRSVAMTNEAAIQGWGDEPVDLLRAMNVRWYSDPTLAADSLSGLREVARHSELPLRLFEVPDPLPRAYLVSEYELAAGPEAALARSLRHGFPLGRRIVLEETPSPPPGPGSGEIISEEYGQNRVRFRTSASGQMLLVVNDRQYPGWTARVDGVEVPILRAGGLFRAISVPPGVSEVEFRFQPTGLLPSAIVSVAGLLALTGLAIRRPAGPAR